MNDVLPDSRLKGTTGSVVCDWPLPNGSTVRIEAVPVFCANCGANKGFVPKENTTWAFFLCDDCFATWGAPAGMMVQSDREFWDAVAYEMLERFGRALTDLEIFALMEQGKLGGGLELLMKESPVKVYQG